MGDPEVVEIEAVVVIEARGLIHDQEEGRAHRRAEGRAIRRAPLALEAIELVGTGYALSWLDDIS